MILLDLRQHGRMQDLEIDFSCPTDGLQRLLRLALSLDGGI